MIKIGVLAILVAYATCMGVTYPSREIFVVDKMFAAAVSGNSPQMALEGLKRVAEGRPDAIDPTLMYLVGLDQAELAILKGPEVRAHALYKIAGTGLPDAVAFLARLKPGDLGQDRSHQIDVAIALGYRQALLGQENDPQRRIELLRDALAERSSSIASWAVNQLCDRDEITLLPDVQKSIRRTNPGERGEAEIRFCEARMDVMNGDVDRVKAFTKTLRVTSDREDVRLIQWSTMQLLALHSSEGDRVLDEFRKVIAALPENSGRRHRCGAANLHTRSGALLYKLVIQQTHGATISCVCL